MTDTPAQTLTVIQLFRKWRSGDESSGQEMAQRFSDWYYAISTIRVPGQAGRPPMEQACQAFAQGIVSVTRPRALVDWAHDLLERELGSAGYGMSSTGSTGSDNPNAMTRNRSPVELILNVAESLDPKHRRILALAYDTNVALSDVDLVADELGGTPYAMLQARYQLKQALSDTQDVPFAVVPENADMDRVPISLYEAQRLASITEIADLEKWLLSDIDLCKDIAEFSAFVHALRGGALQQWAEMPAATPDTADTPKPEPAETASQVSAPAPEATPTVTHDNDLPPVDTEPVSAEIQDEPDAEEIRATPAPKPAATAQPGGAMKAILITGATIAGAVVLLIMIMIYALRAG
jgi:hypothetical protein